MHRIRLALFASLAFTLAGSLAAGQQPTVTYEKDAAGVTYQVTRQPVAAPAQSYQQQVMVPVTEYRLVSRLDGWWNPFSEPTWRHTWEPVTRWEARTATIQAPTAAATSAVASMGNLPAGGVALPARQPRAFPAPQQQVAARASLAPGSGGQQLETDPSRVGAAVRADAADRYRR